MPNTKNIPNLTAVKTAASNAAIGNFAKTVKFPPVTANARNVLQVAKTAFTAEIEKAKAQAAKNAVGGTAATPAAQLAAQQTDIGTQLPSIANYLPAEITPANVTFELAIQSMQDTVTQLDTLIRNPVAGAGSLLGKEFIANNFKLK